MPEKPGRGKGGYARARKRMKSAQGTDYWRKVRGSALTMREREFLLESARFVPKGSVIVNIGVARCASMYCLRAGALSAVLVGVDIVRPVGAGPKLRAEFIIADSRVCHKGFSRPIHLLFIDGDHHYSVVRSDLDNWAAKIVQGGKVILHDCRPLSRHVRKLPHLVDVNRAVNDWFDRTEWREVDAPASMRAFCRL